jgi:exopolysaccharide production protein ExoZ
MTRNYGIEALRGIAANSILIFHITSTWKNSYFLLPNDSFLFSLAENLWFGTDLFFCISGFIFFKYFIKSEDLPHIFIGKRFLRIVPLYWFFTLLVYGINIIQARPESRQQLFCSLTFTCNLGETYPVLPQGWTLQFEILFYLLFAISLFIRPKKRTFFLTISLLFFALILGHSFIFVEFLYGYFACLIARKLNSHIKRVIAVVLSIAIFIFGIYLSGRVGSEFRIFYFGIPSMFIVGTIGTVNRRFKILSNIGSFSYALYLIHFSCLSAVFITLEHLGIAPNLLLLLITLIIINVFAYLIDLFVDKPLRILIKSRNIRQ